MLRGPLHNAGADGNCTECGEPFPCPDGVAIFESVIPRRTIANPRCTPERAERLRALLHQSPRTFGQPTSVWTLDRAAQVSFAQGLLPERDPQLLTRAVIGIYNSVWVWYRPGGALQLADVGRFYVGRQLDLLGCDPELAARWLETAA